MWAHPIKWYCLEHRHNRQPNSARLPSYSSVTMQVHKEGVSAHCVFAGSNPGPGGLTGVVKE